MITYFFFVNECQKISVQKKTMLEEKDKKKNKMKIIQKTYAKRRINFIIIVFYIDNKLYYHCICLIKYKNMYKFLYFVLISLLKCIISNNKLILLSHLKKYR